MFSVVPRIIGLISPRDDGGELLVTRTDNLNMLFSGHCSGYTVRIDDIRSFLVGAGNDWKVYINNQSNISIVVVNYDRSLSWLITSGNDLTLTLDDFLADRYTFEDVIYYVLATATYDSVAAHELRYDHTAIAHTNRAALDLVSGVNTGDQVSGDFDHDGLINTHNLTTDIDHDALTNTHNLTTDIDHDALTNYVADEHIDWTGATDEFVTTEEAYSRDFVSVNSGAITRDVNGFVERVVIVGGRTTTITRNVDGFITSLTDGVYTWTLTRNVDNEITSWSVV